ncbi:hypothetical protein [Hymenobacter sp. CRA2]|uniref:hypothetical protein n=1 Tax=Hymenobacter sp. CRA2 TaxID=1955620 RepID=UPI00098F3D84|nr:hypothetical protein [Hymenobacter sp. CRA2]OON66814.1 hypothetical protein B0919_20845 [Hymenobacter sp. CRA2]
MQDTYSNDQLQAYGRRLAARLCDQYFATQPVGATLDGPAVLRLAPVRQLNLYVVQQLLAQWTQEMARLRSPYFDYEDPAVRQALTQLMNLLSRRIRLTRATYEPLLAQAVADTLRTALDPVTTFENKLLPSDQLSATPAQLRDALRYVDINKPLFQDFIDSLPADLAQDREFLLSRFRLYRDAHFKEQQPLATLLTELNAVLPVQETDLRKGLAPVSEPLATAAQAPVPASPSAPITPSIAPAAVSVSEATPAAPTPAVTAAPVVAVPVAEAKPVIEVEEPAVPAVPAASATPVVAVAAEPAVPSPSPAPEPVPAERPKPLAATVAPASTLADKLAATAGPTSTLNEKLASSTAPHPILAEAQPKVESLRSAISINQRFSFINELFNGENMEYHAAVEHLDALPSADAAKRYVTEDLAQRYQWVRKEEHVNKLLRLIDRKFA